MQLVAILGGKASSDLGVIDDTAGVVKAMIVCRRVPAVVSG